MKNIKITIAVLALLVASCGVWETGSEAPTGNLPPSTQEVQKASPEGKLEISPTTEATSIPTFTTMPPPSPETANPPESLSCEGVSIANPATTYCGMMGYSTSIQETDAGQVGMCQFPDGTSCDEWAFMAGKCGAEFSYCAKNGFDIKTVSEGGDPFSSEYAVCLDGQGNVVGPVSQLSGLLELINKCGG